MNGLVFLILLLIGGKTEAQQQDGYLMLVDAENRMPFTARIGETLVQSSDHGHLLFPQLADSSYLVIISFPKKNLAEKVFPVAMHKKDQGMLLKAAENDWVLYNWQSKETIRALKNPDSTLFLEKGVRREDGFSRLMAAVVNDSSVMYNIYGKRSLARDGTIVVKAKDSAGKVKLVKNGKKSKKSADTVAVVNPPVDNVAAVPSRDTVVVASNVRADRMVSGGSSVRKLREVSLKISRKIVFLDQGSTGSSDTVTCFLFFDKDSLTLAKTSGKARADSILMAKAAKKAHSDSLNTARVKARADSLKMSRSNLRSDSLKTAKTTPGKVGKAISDSVSASKTGRDLAAQSQAPAAVETATAATSVAPPACLQAASDNDLTSLRSTILNVNSVQDKLSIIYGALAIKCFSAAQLRALAELFVSDKSRYRLFEMGLGHVSDPQNFNGLEDLLTDKAFIRKFKSLADHKG